MNVKVYNDVNSFFLIDFLFLFAEGKTGCKLEDVLIFLQGRTAFHP